MTTPAAPPVHAAWIRAYVRRAAEGFGLRKQCVFAAGEMQVRAERVDSGSWVWEAAVRVVEEETE